MNRARTVIWILLLTLGILTLQACGDTMTAPDDTSDTIVCYWIDGVLHCFETD